MSSSRPPGQPPATDDDDDDRSPPPHQKSWRGLRLSAATRAVTVVLLPVLVLMTLQSTMPGLPDGALPAFMREVAGPAAGSSSSPSSAALCERLATAADQMRRVLAQDDEMRVARLQAEEKATPYDAAAVANALVYPPNPGAAEEKGDDAIFRATVEALLLSAEEEGDAGRATSHTYTVLLRGASVSAGGDEVGNGRDLLHQEQVVALLQAAFNHTPVDWQLLDIAKGNTETSDSLATWNLFDASYPRDHVRLVLWEYTVNDERNMKHPPTFERWIRTYLHWYPQADLGFIFIPGAVGAKPQAPAGADDTLMNLAYVSDLEQTYGQVIDHYAPYVAQAGGQAQQPAGLLSASRRSLFSVSLGRYIEAMVGPSGNGNDSTSSTTISSTRILLEGDGRPRLRFRDYYNKPPDNPHPNKLGYWAMGDVLAHHLKSRMRAALSFVDRVSDPSSPIASLRQTLREAAGMGSSSELVDNDEEERLRSSPWLSFADESSSSSNTASAPADAAKENDEKDIGVTGRNAAGQPGVPWFFPPPPALGSDAHVLMTNETHMAGTVVLHSPSPRARDIEGVTVECRRADGTTTMEPGMAYQLFDLVEQTGCVNLVGVRLPSTRIPGRLDYDCNLAPPPCSNYPEQSYKLYIPFSFRRFGGFVLWPPAGLELYVNDTLMPPAPGAPPVAPFWEFDPPLPAGTYLRMCDANANGDRSTIALYKSLSFT